MQKLTCEMCGSSDLIKQDGVFVCQSCGVKYTLEEARKMMIEGTVEVKGTVKIDNSNTVENYLINARKAKEVEDWESVQKFYSLVKQNDPSNVEATFYDLFSRVKMSLLDEDLSKRFQAFSVFANGMLALGQNFDISRNDLNQIAMFSKDMMGIKNSRFVYKEIRNAEGKVASREDGNVRRLFKDAEIYFCRFLESVCGKIPYENNSAKCWCINIALAHAKNVGERELVNKYTNILMCNDTNFAQKVKEEKERIKRITNSKKNIIFSVITLALVIIVGIIGVVIYSIVPPTFVETIVEGTGEVISEPVETPIIPLLICLIPLPIILMIKRAYKKLLVIEIIVFFTFALLMFAFAMIESLLYLILMPLLVCAGVLSILTLKERKNTK